MTEEELEKEVGGIVEATFAPAIDFRAPYAKFMREKASKDVLSRLKELGVLRNGE